MAVSRVVFVVLNILFVLIGLGAVGMGVYGLVDPEGIIVIPKVLGIAAIVAGFMCALLAFLGCCSAVQRSRGCLVFYFVVILVLVLAELAGGIAGFIFRSDMDNWLREAWIFIYENDPQTLVRLEQSLACCGFNSTTDYAVAFNSTMSCPYGQPCREQVRAYIDPRLVWVAVAFFGVAAIQIVGLLLSCCVRVALREEEESSQPLIYERADPRYGVQYQTYSRTS